jgi:hypothetical protein
MGLPLPDPCSICTLSSTEFVDPLPPKKIPGYATGVSKHRTIIIAKIGPHKLSCRWLGLVYLSCRDCSFYHLVSCALLSCLMLCFWVMLPENILVRNILPLSLYHSKHWIQASLCLSLCPPFICFGIHSRVWFQCCHHQLSWLIWSCYQVWDFFCICNTSVVVIVPSACWTVAACFQYCWLSWMLLACRTSSFLIEVIYER